MADKNFIGSLYPLHDELPAWEMTGSEAAVTATLTGILIWEAIQQGWPSPDRLEWLETFENGTWFAVVDYDGDLTGHFETVRH